MSVSDGQRVNAAVTNAAYISRTTDSDTVAVVGLNNVSSGGLIANAQQAINDNTTNITSNDVDIADLQANKENKSEKDQPNGYAGLDGSGKIASSALPTDVFEFKGVWNANTNTPTLIDGTGNTGDVYRTSVAGTQDLGSGSQDFNIGDWVTYNGTIWERSDFASGTDVLTTKGDLLTRDAITNVRVPVGVDGEVLVADSAEPGGIKWAAPTGGSGGLASVQIFTSSGTWNKPAGINTVIVEVLGGGAAGGSGFSTAGGQMSCASGGGAGGYAKKLIDVSAIVSETVTIGAGGVGVAGSTGGAGGSSSFGAHCSATGGAGGLASTASTGGRIASGAAGGIGSSGDINASGGSSESATSDGTTGTGSSGGNSIYGGGGSGRAAVLGSVSVTGISGNNYGAGGSGTCNGQNVATTAGGSGSDGLIVVWEYE